MPESRLARLTARLGVFAAVLFVVGPLLAHFEYVRPLAGFVAFALGGLLGVVAVVLGLIALRGHGRPLVMRGLIPALAVVAVFVGAASRGRGVPRINDITTDTSNPPQFVKAQFEPANLGRDLAYPGESFALQQREGYPDLAPLRLALAPDAAYAKVKSTADGIATWRITRDEPATHTLEGVDESWLFRFKDDFVIQVRPADDGSVVQMRSKSRDGQGDLGANAARIERFFAALNR
jgi:uncharacterized protein (DUF1499 family)